MIDFCKIGLAAVRPARPLQTGPAAADDLKLAKDFTLDIPTFRRDKSSRSMGRVRWGWSRKPSAIVTCCREKSAPSASILLPCQARARWRVSPKRCLFTSACISQPSPLPAIPHRGGGFAAANENKILVSRPFEIDGSGHSRLPAAFRYAGCQNRRRDRRSRQNHSFRRSVRARVER